MKYRGILRLTAIALTVGLISLGLSSKPRRQSASKASFTITTTDLCRNIRGYRGPVPVAVTFSGGKIKEIKILPNHETPSYFQRVERAGITAKFIGLTPAQAAVKKVDAVSGATLSSRALIQNIQTAAREAQKR